MVDLERKLTLLEAYTAMYRFLEQEYELVGADEIGGLLGDMSLLPDGCTADPASWDDWLKAVGRVFAGDTDIGLKFKSK